MLGTTFDCLILVGQIEFGQMSNMIHRNQCKFKHYSHPVHRELPYGRNAVDSNLAGHDETVGGFLRAVKVRRAKRVMDAGW